MYGISSALASQTINKVTAWNCLCLLGKVSGNLTKFDSDRMTVEGWAVGVRVVIKKAYKNLVEVCLGLSTVISPLKIAKQILEQTEWKSRDLNVIRKTDKIFLVDSFQDPTEKHTVAAYNDGLTCSCMKFKCMRNRMQKEAPQLLKALGEVALLDGSKVASTEQFDLRTRNIETKFHIQCHHIRAVMRKAFNAFTSQEYLLNWKKVMSEYRQHAESEIREARDSLFPADNWGKPKPKND